MERWDVPVSVSSTVKALLYGMAGLFVVALLWAVFAELHEGAIASGEVVPLGKNKTIQHPEGGIVREILVKDGDTVGVGQTLLVLDDHEAKAALAQAQTDWSASKALVERLLSERDGKVYSGPRSGDTAVESQLRLYKIRREAFQSELSALNARLVAIRKEQQAWEKRREALDKLADNAGEERKLNQELYEKNYISRTRLLAMDSQVSDRMAARGEAEAELARVMQRISDTDLQIGKLKNDWMNALLEELRRAQDGLAVASERLQVAQERLSRTQMRSPDAGVVKGLRYTTLGAVIPSGGSVLDIVPTEDKMVVEARVLPDDIDVVHIGMPAWVRLTAYKARAHMAFNGKVIDLSPSTFLDEKVGLRYYAARVELSSPSALLGENVSLQPGMLAEVSFSGKPRSPLRYLFDPLLQSMGRAFKEE